jgi:hypothetical protein
MIISQILLGGVYLTTYLASDPEEEFMFEDPEAISEQVCETRVENFREAQENLSTPKIDTSLNKYQDTLKTFVLYIKANPSITLTGFNNYLSSLHWTESAVIRFTVLQLYNYLAENYPAIQNTSSEATLLGIIRDKIVELPLKKIQAILLK